MWAAGDNSKRPLAQSSFTDYPPFFLLLFSYPSRALLQSHLPILILSCDATDQSIFHTTPTCLLSTELGFRCRTISVFSGRRRWPYLPSPSPDTKPKHNTRVTCHFVLANNKKNTGIMTRVSWFLTTTITTV